MGLSLAFCPSLVLADTAVEAEDRVEELGLWRENRPLVKVIQIQDGEAPIPESWRGPGGYEYWLYAPGVGSTGYLSHDGRYSPYSGSCSDANASQAWCDTVPSELARRCMFQAGETLRAIMESPPQEWHDFLEQNEAPYFYGWIDDGATLGYSGRMHTGPFRWHSYMKWAGNVKPDGTCTTGSLGQFIHQLQVFHDSCVFRRPEFRQGCPANPS
jgi:hypothetical protein